MLNFLSIIEVEGQILYGTGRQGNDPGVQKPCLICSKTSFETIFITVVHKWGLPGVSDLPARCLS
jgi:hypothetical protein